MCSTTDIPIKNMLSCAAWGETNLISTDWGKKMWFMFIHVFENQLLVKVFWVAVPQAEVVRRLHPSRDPDLSCPDLRRNFDPKTLGLVKQIRILSAWSTRLAWPAWPPGWLQAGFKSAASWNEPITECHLQSGFVLVWLVWPPHYLTTWVVWLPE